MSRPPAGWLSKLPDRWTLTPAKTLFSERREPSSRDDVHLTPSQAYGVLPQTEYMAITGGRVVLNLAGSDKMKHVEPNDFVIHLRSFQGGIEHSPARGKVSVAYTVLTPRRGIEPRYYRWLLKSDAYVQELRTTTNQLRDGQSIKYGNFAQIALPRPPEPEQRAIADFLDRETARIDTLIAKQERLITALRERRLLTVRIATGWVGELRPTWTCQRLSWVFRSTGSGTTPAAKDLVEPSESTIPWVTTGELREREVTTTRLSVTPSTIAEYSALRIHPAGSLLVAMYGATIGRTAILGVDAATNQACCALTDPVRASARFVEYSLLAARDKLLLDAAGGGQPNINQDKLRSFRIPLPPADEQDVIVSQLEDSLLKIDSLIEKTERFISLSKERRSALITAAVTGQLDVRAEVA